MKGALCVLVLSVVDFWGRNCVRQARWRGGNRTASAIKSAFFTHFIPQKSTLLSRRRRSRANLPMHENKMSRIGGGGVNRTSTIQIEIKPKEDRKKRAAFNAMKETKNRGPSAQEQDREGNREWPSTFLQFDLHSKRQKFANASRFRMREVWKLIRRRIKRSLRDLPPPLLQSHLYSFSLSMHETHEDFLQ